MKTLFQFGDQNIKASTVLCEWGRQYCCLAGYDGGSNNVIWLTYKTYDSLNESIIKSIVDEVSSTGSVVVGSAFSESILTPLNYNGEEALQQLYSPAQPVIALFDTINEWQVKNYYLIPKAIHTAFNDKFSNVSYINFFTAALKNNNGYGSSDQIAVHFSPNQFSVLVKKSGQLQLAQTYSYQAPLDVIYYLLKMVEEFNLSKEEVALVISGLIDEKSDLYREIYQYFLNVHFSETLGLKGNHTYPSHFFTSIFNLTTCVS